MSNENSGFDIFGDLDNSFQQEEKYTYSQNKTDQIKELGLDDIDSSSDDDDDEARPSTSKNQQSGAVSKTSLKRTLSADSDNDYDGDFTDADETRYKKIKQFTDELNQENDQKYMNENSNNNHNMSLNDNNTNNLSYSNDGEAGSSNAATSSKESKEANAKAAKERLNYEKEKAWRKKRLEQQEEENKKMQVLMANFNDEQLNRYEMFRRSAFQKASVKKIIQTVCGKAVSHDVIIAMSGMAKVFVGEMVELALDIQQKWNETGPLHPKHIREASRIYKKTSKVATSNKYKKPSMFI